MIYKYSVSNRTWKPSVTNTQLFYLFYSDVLLLFLSQIKSKLPEVCPHESRGGLPRK